MRAGRWEYPRDFPETAALIGARVTPAEDGFRALAVKRAERTLRSAEVTVTGAWDSGGLAGVGAVRVLPWDSAQFGFTAGRLELFAAISDYRSERCVFDSLIAEAIDNCRDKGIVHLIARVGANELAAVHALEGAGFELLDGIQNLSLTMNAAPQIPAHEWGFRLSTREDEDALAAIAREMFRLDRFHADHALPPGCADRVHEAWVRNSCRGQGADAVVVCDAPTGAAGFVTCRIDEDAPGTLGVGLGTIVLVAVASGCARHGVALTATLHALSWFYDRGVRVVEVGTQIRNIPAAAVYQKAGFRAREVSLTFRRTFGIRAG